MSDIPTESRIFANRFFRDVHRLETLHAGRISPGATDWREAMRATYVQMGRAGKPDKQVAIISKVADYLRGVAAEDRIHLTISETARKRAAILCVATFSAGRHPLEGVAEEGLSIVAHALKCKRDGDAGLISGTHLAYISKHAIARLHERGDCRDDVDVRGVLGYAGVLGHLLQHSDKHDDGEICLHVGNALVIGSLKYAAARAHDEEGRERLIGGTLYDVRTVLPAGEVRNSERLEQGRIAGHVVEAWFARQDGIGELVNEIPFLPRREDDFTLRTAIVRTA